MVFGFDFDNDNDGHSSGSTMAFSFGWGRISILSLIFYIIYTIGLWKVFEKAHEKSWAALIPIYNIMVEIKIAGRPYWWILLYLIPVFQIIPFVIVKCNLGDCFGKTACFKLGLIVFSNIFLIILGFDDSHYTPSVDSVHT